MYNNLKIKNILIVGSWRWPIYEDAFAKALEYNGVKVDSFSTSQYFRGQLGKIGEAIPFFSFLIYKLNFDLYRKIRRTNPDIVLFWRPTHIFPYTIKQIKQKSIKVISYNNDDPFGPKSHGNVPWHHHFLWFWYFKTLNLYNINFFYRQVNCYEANVFGSLINQVLMPYYIPWKDKPVFLNDFEKQKYSTDVVFIGHYESDGREQLIRLLVESNIKIKIWGGDYWNREVLGNLYDILEPISPVDGDEYSKALCGAKICLGLLSKLNRDTYTRRCFEIPACGQLLLAERTDDLLRIFVEDEEACFFSSPEELIRKVKWLLLNDHIRLRIAKAGHLKVLNQGHDVISRANYFLKCVSTIV